MSCPHAATAQSAAIRQIDFMHVILSSIHAFLSLLLAIATLAAQPPSFPARVTGIADGDTLTVLHGTTPERIRLWGIDAPEARQPYSKEARRLASSLAFGKTVTVRVVSKDRYLRKVAVVILPDGRNLNHELVRAGLAWWYRRYAPADPDLEKAEDHARRHRTGLWRDPHPTPPWLFRK